MTTAVITTRFWLIRHGKPAGEARGRCYGSLDIGLSERGRAQMARVGKHLKDEPIAAIYSSPRRRALESARILEERFSTSVMNRAQRHERSASLIACPTNPDLREIDFGDFEGLSYDDIAARYPELYRQWMETPTEVRFPKGENFREMRGRVLETFDSIEREWRGQTVAIVSHGGVNRILIAWALQIPDKYLFRVAQDYAAVNLLMMEDGVPSVKLVNHGVT
jgi:alpha-ribazole phosphatase